MVSRLVMCWGLIGGSLLSGSTAVAQNVLTWKFAAGETLKYSVEQSTDMQMDMSGQKQSLNITQQMDMSWKINEVSDDGTTRMAQMVDRLQLKSAGGPFGSVQFDSSSSEVPETKLVRAMAEVIKKLIGQEFLVTMMPSGHINDVVIPQALLDQLRRAGAAGEALNEDMLRQMMTQSAVTLPVKAIKPGDSWSSSQQTEMNFGTMHVDSKLTFTGIDSATGMAEIVMRPVVTVTPKEGNPVELTVVNSAGEGNVQFDTKNGRIAKSNLDLTLDLIVKRYGSEVKLGLRQATAMNLVP